MRCEYVNQQSGLALPSSDNDVIHKTSEDDVTHKTLIFHNQRMDMLMEVDRLKELQQREQTEEARRVKRLDDRSVIVEQMRGRGK